MYSSRLSCMLWNASPRRLSTSRTVVHRSSFLASLSELTRLLEKPKGQSEKSAKTKPCKLRSELALEIGYAYMNLPPLQRNLAGCDRENALLFLTSKSFPAEKQIKEAINIFQTEKDQIVLRHMLKPPYERVIDYVIKQDVLTGLEFVIAMRKDLMSLSQAVRSTVDDEKLTQLKELNQYLQRLLSLWFSSGMLELRRITYEDTSAKIIEQIALKEKVHPMQSLADLRSRLGPGRRVFALFSPLLPERPLVFCHVVLSCEIPSRMSQVLGATEEPEQTRPRTATFYSISNSELGLAGLHLGEYLLKTGIGQLKKEFSSIENFVTLSPIPGFRKWAEAELSRMEEDDHTSSHDKSTKDDVERLKPLLNLKANELEKIQEADFSASNEVLLKLACRYLLMEKDDGRPLCGVARFHIGNGASLHRINAGANPSSKGTRQSFSLMVNYRYDLATISENQAAYETDYSVSAGPLVLECLTKME